jgi:peptidoglycan/xylan/chitin deacetylase (PgdA/CDA1 family)
LGRAANHVSLFSGHISGGALTPRVNQVWGLTVIYDLPRGRFGAYLRAHYLNDKASAAQRFSMGCGAIFMIQRVAALDASLASRGAIAETDPSMLEEMVSLVAALKLDVVSLAEMRRRLAEGDLRRRFICFTFDGAYRSVQDIVLPLFQKRGLPFAVYVATDFLDNGSLPWWLSLEALLTECDRLSLDMDGEREELRCRSRSEKLEAFTRLFRRLSKQDRQLSAALLEAAMRKQGIDGRAAAERALLSRDEVRQLGQRGLVTVASQAGGAEPLSELSFDRARESVQHSLEALEAATGTRPRHFAFPGGGGAKVSARDIRIVGDLGLDTAVTSIEGALWPEHKRELMSLPRIALDNDPATLVRALMLSGASLPAGGPAIQSAAG